MNKHNIFILNKDTYKTETFLTMDSSKNWEFVQSNIYKRLKK